MHTAKPQGPAKSPNVLETCNADSANADAHCPIAISEEPAQIIRTIKIQNAFVLKSSSIVMLLPSSTNVSIGQVAKL